MPATVKGKNRVLRERVDAALAAAQIKWDAKARGKGKATSKGKSKANSSVAGNGPTASIPVSTLWAVLEGFRKAGVQVHFPSDGTTSDVSNLMG